MITVKEVREITGQELLFLLFFVSGRACPGLLAIWYFSPQMIGSCSTFMLIILSIALTLPIVSINTFLTLYAIFQHHLDKKYGEIVPMCVAVGSCAVMLTMGIPMLITFLFSLSLKFFVWAVLGGETLFLGICGLLGLAMYKPSNKIGQK